MTPGPGLKFAPGESVSADLNHLSDGELLRAATEGDEQAFAEFCVRALPTFLGLLRSRCRHFGLPPDLAHDAGQETILRAINAYRKDPSVTPSLRWLITIGTNVLRDWARSRQRMPNVPDEVIGELSSTEETTPQLYDDVLAALERLPVKDREILELVLIQELTPEEAADQLGIGKWAGYKRYERALVRLKSLLPPPEMPG
ncbi:MAG TPA: RNA polymerase sigma factor [Gemmataceae bacterium]|nr:RNA polymerase sigma factor [Gemmataceae bacterium]